jgi:DNA-binding XRE family transcriptional regulator
MNAREFSELRRRLEKTQKEMAALLGASLSAVHGYEQGWRNVPPHVERQIFLLASRVRGAPKRSPCWEVKGCPPAVRERCPAWEFQAGDLCWFINGTLCEGKPQRSWAQKMHVCRQCMVLRQTVKGRKTTPKGPKSAAATARSSGRSRAK